MSHLAGGMFENFLHQVGYGPLDVPAVPADDAGEVVAAPIVPVVPLRELDAPLSAYREEMAAAEALQGLPRGIVWAVAVRESTGGKFACGRNAWGWDSCRSTFTTWQEGIDTVSARLAVLIGTFGLEGALSAWVSGDPVSGLWYAREVIAIMAGE